MKLRASDRHLTALRHDDVTLHYFQHLNNKCEYNINVNLIETMTHDCAQIHHENNHSANLIKNKIF